MPLRLVEATLPLDAADTLPGLAVDLPILHWHAEKTEQAILARFLLDAKHVETLSDELSHRCGGSANFRLVILPVEGTVPEIEEEDKEEQGPEKTPERISREELYEDVAQSSHLTGSYLAMVALSTVVAAVGLLRGDVVTIIGAMVIAPFLGPNIALSLAVTLGDLALIRKSLKVFGGGIALALALSFLAGRILSVDPALPEIASRTRLSLADLILALSAGTAGTLAFTSGVSTVVVGVMVAVALLPPLVVVGLLAGAGHVDGALRAFALFLANVVSINLAAVGTFLAQKVSPRSWWEAHRARKSTLVAVMLWVFLLGVLIALILTGQMSTSPP